MRRNKFSLSNYHLLTMSMGELVPVYIEELLPGTTIRQQTSALVRCGVVPLAPIMHPVLFRIHTFDVPYRLLWDNFEEWITGFDADGDATTAGWPYINLNTNVVAESSIYDYMGLPVIDYTGKGLKVSALPFRAYNLIWNEYYRDAQVVDAITVSKADGADATSFALKKVMWPKDFYTTARPSAQIGTDITIPVGETAEIHVPDGSTATGRIDVYDDLAADYKTLRSLDATAGGNLYTVGTPAANYEMYADLSAATGISVGTLAEYVALQRYAENLNERGHRYVEYLNWAFGIKGKQDWLPEYVSGGKKVISWSEVLATGGADAGSNSSVGALRGHGIGALKSRRAVKFIKEHTLRMTLVSMVPKAIYADGIPRMFRRDEKEDYFTKELELIGDRPIENLEVYADHTTPEGTFGYQQRYDSYRTGDMGNRISGEFQSTLNYWHYARLFSGDPSLNETFLTCNPTKRQYADNSSDTFQVFVNNSVQVRQQVRKFPKKRIL